MANITVSSSVDSMLKASSASDIRHAIGSTNYPYTTDFQSGVEQTRNLTSITSSDGFYYTNQPSSIYIGTNVTSIGTDAMRGNPLTSLLIPSSVTSVGDYAFVFSLSLTSLTLSDGLLSIGSGAFYGCSAITELTIPNTVTSLGSSAFGYCTNLINITLSNSITTIGSATFRTCTSLPSVNIPDGVTAIGSDAFYFCSSLSTINCLATTAPTLGANAFNGVAATEIHVPVGATGYGATYGGLTVIDDL